MPFCLFAVPFPQVLVEVVPVSVNSTTENNEQTGLLQILLSFFTALCCSMAAFFLPDGSFGSAGSLS